MSYFTIQNITYTLWEVGPSLGCWGGSSCRSFYALCHSLYAVHQPLNLYMLQIQCSFREFRSSAKALNGFLLPAYQVSYEQDPDILFGWYVSASVFGIFLSHIKPSNSIYIMERLLTYRNQRLPQADCRNQPCSPVHLSMTPALWIPPKGSTFDSSKQDSSYATLTEARI